VSKGPLAARIARLIAAEGPISVAAFVAMALHDPNDGYYAHAQPIGADGDFITAPETSQIFGELIGLWFARMWEAIGRPDPVVLAELGPGRGSLARDLLRAAGTVPAFRRALRLYLIETSPRLRAEQQRRLADAAPVWLDAIDGLPAGPLLLVANEFLDALPIRQFIRGPIGWSERMVALDPAGALVFADMRASPAAALLAEQARRGSALSDEIVEICPAALALAASLGDRLVHQPGAALFIDYGYADERRGMSLRAVRRHRPVPALEHPGAADLSADVDFGAFAQAARSAGAGIRGPVSQARFLTSLGAKVRLAALSAGASPAERSTLGQGLERLLDPEGMGGFKVMAMTSPNLPLPDDLAVLCKSP
jgi:NADH dehydrogenase [ubiquinone] 1 alpha subcomplex assembly factor 7